MADAIAEVRGARKRAPRFGAPSFGPKRKRVFHADRHNAGYWFILPALVLLLALIVYPLVSGFVISLFNTNLLAQWNFVGLQYYISNLASSELWADIGTTLIYTFGVVAGNLIVGTVLAVLLNRKMRFRTVFRAILILPWLFPEVVVAIIWKWLLNPLYGPTTQILALFGYHGAPVQWLDTPVGAMAGIIIASIWKGYPLVLITVLAGLQTIPSDLYEAAGLDGAGKIRSFFSITLPNLRPVLLIVVILETVWYFKQFTIPYVMTSGGPVDATRLISLDIYQTAFSDFQFGRAASMAVIVFAICLAITFIYRRIIRER
jgi:multiple sugar transport system permease protein